MAMHMSDNCTGVRNELLSRHCCTVLLSSDKQCVPTQDEILKFLEDSDEKVTETLDTMF